MDSNSCQESRLERLATCLPFKWSISPIREPTVEDAELAVRPFYRGRAVNCAEGMTTQACKTLRSDAHSRCTEMTGVEHASFHINCIIDSLNGQKDN
jgi:hypothetical protein